MTWSDADRITYIAHEIAQRIRLVQAIGLPGSPVTKRDHLAAAHALGIHAQHARHSLITGSQGRLHRSRRDLIRLRDELRE